MSMVSLISANKVIHLNSDNFDTIVDGSRNVFLKFEASWCGPCKRMAPIMDQVARDSFPDLNGEVILAAIDADKERDIGDRFDINSFPTVKLFLKGRSHEDAIEFTGERSPQNIEKFIKYHVAMNNQTLPADELNTLPSIPLTEILTDNSWPLPLKTSLEPAFNSVNYKSFVSNSLNKFKIPEQYMKQPKAKKPKTRTNKTTNAVRTTVSVEDKFPSVDARRAQEIVLNSGAKPVIIIFYSPSTKIIFFSFFIYFNIKL